MTMQEVENRNENVNAGGEETMEKVGIIKRGISFAKKNWKTGAVVLGGVALVGVGYALGHKNNGTELEVIEMHDDSEDVSYDDAYDEELTGDVTEM